MFGKKKIAAAVMAAFCVTAFAASGFAEEQSETPEAKTVVTVGNETLSDREMLQLLQSSANGNIMMVGLMLTQSTLADRTEMANQMADTMLFAEGARLDGLTEREDIAFKLKWQRIQLLVEAYINERSQKWDMSEKAMKDYYNSHKDEFVQAEGAHVRHILMFVSDLTPESEVVSRLNDIKHRIENGAADFATMARLTSVDNSAAMEPDQRRKAFFPVRKFQIENTALLEVILIALPGKIAVVIRNVFLFQRPK